MVLFNLISSYKGQKFLDRPAFLSFYISQLNKWYSKATLHNRYGEFYSLGSDLFYPRRSLMSQISQQKPLNNPAQDAVIIHIINHSLKSRDIVLKSNESFKNMVSTSNIKMVYSGKNKTCLGIL